MSKAVVTFGRLNPPTIGHEKLVNKVRSIASKEGAMPHVYLSHSQDKKKNPLSYNDKVKFCQKAFGKIVIRSKANTIIKVMQELEEMGHTDIILVVGSDRVQGMSELLQKYNGKDYNFNNIKVVSAGERDPDAEGVEGMSASKMRKLAAEDNLEEFTKGLPRNLQSMAKKVFDKVRKG